MTADAVIADFFRSQGVSEENIAALRQGADDIALAGCWGTNEVSEPRAEELRKVLAALLKLTPEQINRQHNHVVAQYAAGAKRN